MKRNSGSTAIFPGVKNFLTALERGRLVTPEQLEEAKEIAPRKGAKLPGILIKKGWITKWQWEQLRASKPLYLSKYKLLDKIGEGGQATVYKADHPGLGKPVVIKVLNQNLIKGREAVARFHREIQAAAALVHPNIVTAYDADCIGRTHFLVMEYVDGSDLENATKQFGAMQPAYACECIQQAAMGLQYAHENGLMHRDIKPSNLFVSVPDPKGPPVVKILDFGLARFVIDTHDREPLTKPGQFVGTYDYMAPEQAENVHGADIRADIFALGCTLFKVLTCQLPYPGESVTQKLLARLNRPATPLREVLKSASPELEAVLARMLARNPDDRYSTPQEVAEALAPFCNNDRRGDYRCSVRRRRSNENTPVSTDTGALTATLVDVDIRTDPTVEALATDDIPDFLKAVEEHVNAADIGALAPKAKPQPKPADPVVKKKTRPAPPSPQSQSESAPQPAPASSNTVNHQTVYSVLGATIAILVLTLLILIF